MRNYLLVLFVLLAGTAGAQNKDFKVRADKAFATRDYTTAAYYYERSLLGGTATAQGKVPYFSLRQGNDSAARVDIRYKLAESYRLSRNFALAEPLYRQVLAADETKYLLARLWHGVCLRAGNELDAAITEVALFISTNAGNKSYAILGNNELKNCLYAKAQLAKATTTTVVKLQDTFSPEENDFAMGKLGEQTYFTGTLAAGPRKNINQLFLSNGDSLTKDSVINLLSDPKDALHTGSQTMDASGRTMYFTGWSRKDGQLVAAIYMLRFNEGQWTGLQKLNSFVNVDGFYAMQPFVTPDGKQLYFVSNRPNGFGGDDIWKCDLDQEGLPASVVNLGKTINSAADEASPFYQLDSKKLVFSSKGYVGMGNFDLYESTGGTESGWTAPRNLGFPYNSTKDDLYYYTDDKTEETAYLSSDRESACCLNLFKVQKVKAKPLTLVFTGKVVDCDTGLGLANVAVELLDEQLESRQRALTDEAGKYHFTIGVKRKYELKFEKDGYFSKVVKGPMVDSVVSDTLAGATVCLKMFEVDKPIVIENVLYDFNKAVLKPESLIVLDDLVSLMNDNPKIKFELSSHTDSIGPDWYNNRLSQQRAQACVDYIVSRGVFASRISAKGYGESRPIQPNSLPNGKDNKDGRRLNRRTEFKVLSIE